MSAKTIALRLLHTGAMALIVTASGNVQAAPLVISDVPLFLNPAVPPLNMIIMGRDHKLYYEAYNDASDLNNDGVLDTKYKGYELKSPAPDPDLGVSPYKIDYFGYFDSFKCYTYDSGGSFWDPVAVVGAGKTCADPYWSGDFLNYLTTSRIDALRKVMYGGDRRTDTATDTILERSYIPQDAHSWGKDYRSVADDGYNIADYTPLSLPTGTNNRHFFASTTPRGTGAAVAALYDQAPLLRVAENVTGGRRIWNWVSKERPVAHYSTTGSFMDNGTDGAGYAMPTVVDRTVRVKVCKKTTPQTLPLEPNCKLYPDGNYKPTGIIQEYGEGASPRMYFGLMTGSYARNTSGGVLRRRMGGPSLPLSDEINTGNGTFNTGTTGIIATLNRMHGTGFSASNATDAYAYNSAYTGQSCGWITNGPIAEGQCQMWGNPIAEIMFESLRYFSGNGNPIFGTTFGQGEEGQLPGGGLPTPTWDNPYSGSRPTCSKPFQTVISDINPTYDTDQLPGSAFSSFTNTDLPGPGLDVEDLGDLIWNHEMGGSRNVFIGQSGATVNSAPTPKTVTSFGNIRGLAPEDPTKLGGYYSASVAYYGHENDINPATGPQKVTTFAVALASPLPKIAIPVNGRTVTLVPFAKSVGGAGIVAAEANFQPTNQIVDFYVDSITPTTGKFRVNFEDVEQGADHDMDAIVVYEYSVSGSNITVTLTSEYAAGGIVQHMGYIISGTTNDGIFLEVRDFDTAVGSDIDYYLDTPPTYSGSPRPAPATAAGWDDDVALPLTATRTFQPGSTGGAILLKDPLWYAAKWGGFEEVPATTNGLPNLASEWDTNNDGNPDNYFLVTNALDLGQQLAAAFDEIARRVGSASSASVNAGSISSQTRVYQAKFNSGDWTGQLFSFPVQQTDDPLTPENEIGMLLAPDWEASTRIPDDNSRVIITRNNGGTAVRFRWANIGATRQNQLQPLGDGKGQARLNYLRGDGSQERPIGEYRNRPSKLGDIVSSSPVFVGAPRAVYPDSLHPTAPHSAFRASRAGRPTMVYTGANDGMLHAFNGVTGVEAMAFIPGAVFPNLHELTRPSYSHRFFVDGTPTVGDAFYGGAWHTVLVGGLNRGGRSVYSLDVTNPENFSEANATSIVKWEYTNAELGFTYSRPAIVRMANGQWAAVFGSGYHTASSVGGTGSTGRAVLFIVDIGTGTLIRKIDTTVGTVADPNGLGTPAMVDLNGDSIVDYAYAGDLQGNLWKFNLTSNVSTDWDVAFISGTTKSPLFVATNAGGVRQPITSKPEVGLGPKGVGMIILFGTGKFMELSDKSPTETQSFYGVIDKNTIDAATDIVSGRSVMTRQQIIFEGPVTFTTVPDGPDADSLPDVTATTSVRVTTQNALTGSTDRGWYLDLLSPPAATPVFRGEMQVSDSVLRNGRIIFTTLIPDDDPCSTGGTSWLMEMDALTGARLEESPLDVNRDGEFTEADYVEVIIDGVAVRVPVSGMESDVGIAQKPGILSSEDSEFKYLSGTTANASGSNIQRAVENPGPNARGRQSWRQIK